MGDPKRLDEILAQVIYTRGYGLDLTVSEYEDAWNELVGTGMANRTTPTRLRNGVLEIVVENSTLVQELTFQKPELVKSLAERLPNQNIRDLRFRVGKI